MKALTIWQPWASLVACGAKQYETRSWPTKYRGPIAIHAAIKDPCKLPLLDKAELERFTWEEINARRCPGWCLMPRGKIIATAELVDVLLIENISRLHPETPERIDIEFKSMNLPIQIYDPHFHSYIAVPQREIALGDWTPGRYAWELANVKVLPEPIQVKGKQGIWNFELKKEDTQK